MCPFSGISNKKYNMFPRYKFKFWSWSLNIHSRDKRVWNNFMVFFEEYDTYLTWDWIALEGIYYVHEPIIKWVSRVWSFVFLSYITEIWNYKKTPESVISDFIFEHWIFGSTIQLFWAFYWASRYRGKIWWRRINIIPK